MDSEKLKKYFEDLNDEEKISLFKKLGCVKSFNLHFYQGQWIENHPEFNIQQFIRDRIDDLIETSVDSPKDIEIYKD